MGRSDDKVLSNVFVKDYYDTQVGALTTTYEENRWHTSPVKEFEYRQTLRALRAALGGRIYVQGVEIGPGDGVWTRVIREHVAGNLHLIEQSEEMLKGAKDRLMDVPNLTFEHSNFQSAQMAQGKDLIVALRCFEYFDDKQGALEKMRAMLAPAGQIVIVTKNKDMVTTHPVQNQTLHSDQVSRGDMKRLAKAAGLEITATYPAVLRWKASWGFMRLIFDLLHRVGVWSRGMLTIPILTTYATESYVYILHAKK